MSVDKYAREFEKLQIKCDKHEPEEQTIVRYLVDSNLSMLAWWSSSNLPFLMKYMFLHIRWTNKREGTFSGMSVPNPPKHSPYPLNKPLTRGVQIAHLQSLLRHQKSKPLKQTPLYRVNPNPFLKTFQEVLSVKVMDTHPQIARTEGS